MILRQSSRAHLRFIACPVVQRAGRGPSWRLRPQHCGAYSWFS